MANKKLTQAAIDAVLTDSTLYKEVADTMQVRPGTVAVTISRNGPAANDFDVVKVIAKHLQCDPEDIQVAVPKKIKQVQKKATV